MRNRLGLVVAIALLGPIALAAQAAYHIARPPAWVKPIPAEAAAPTPPGPVTEGYEMLLVDFQESVRDRTVERFKHIAYRVLDEGAVQDNSQIEIVFDSSYEQLVIHAVTVQRAGRTINQLKPARIRVVQRESRMDYQIYDGSLSLVLLLEDVRRGDVIEYSYTLRGANPVFSGHYMSEVTLQRTVPLRRLSVRLVWPRERPLFIRRYETTLEPTVRDAGPYREYVWSDTAVPPKLLDDDLPAWYDPLPEIQLSDFASWSQVAAWGDTLFASAGPAPPALAAPLAAIRAAHRTQEERTLAALRFVQEDIRYLGVEIGVNSHLPYSPAVVMRRRYGDCKDKALLLVTMLRELGVTAHPALVSTDYVRHIRDFLPTAGIFDHAIVEAELDGHVYWLDPTALYERGDLASGTPPFEAALVLGGGAGDSVAAIPPSSSAQPLTEIAVSFDVHGVGVPAGMRVETRYSGRAADGIRSSIRSTSIESMRKRYTSFYAEVYPSIRSEAPPEVHDDEAVNVVRTVERYSIPEFWHASRSQDDTIGTFDALELAKVIPSATAAARSMPLLVDHPVHIRYTIDAQLAQGWNIAARDVTLETPAVRFTYHIRAREDTLSLSYEYQTLADHVSADQAADHLAKLSRAGKLLVFIVTPPSTTAPQSKWKNPQELNWTVLLLALLTAGIAVVAAVRVYRAPPPAWPRGPEGVEPSLSGLGGWLVLVALGVCLTPLWTLSTLVRNGPAYSASSWARLTMPGGAAYDPLWAPTLLFELVYNVSLLVFVCLQAWAFFRRKRLFPALFVVIAAVRVVVDWLDLALAHAITTLQSKPVNWEAHLGTLFSLTLWSAYMFRSRRVHNTFIK